MAIDRDSREIVGLNVCGRNRMGAEKLWKSLPPVYRQCAVSSTDFQSAYEVVLPLKRHRSVGKKVEKQIILNDSTLQCDNEFPAW